MSGFLKHYLKNLRFSKKVLDLESCSCEMFPIRLCFTEVAMVSRVDLISEKEVSGLVLWPSMDCFI